MTIQPTALASGSVHLTPPQRKIIESLIWADYSGQCYLVHTARGRYALLLPTRWGLVRHVQPFHGPSIRQLRDRGLVILDETGVELEYRQRLRGDSATGHALTVTDAGRAAAAAAGAKL